MNRDALDELIAHKTEGLAFAGGDRLISKVESLRAAAGLRKHERRLHDLLEVRFSEAVRPRTGLQVPVCQRCQGKYTPQQFPEGVIFEGK